MEDLGVNTRKIILILLIFIIAFIPLIYYPSDAYTEVDLGEGFTVKVPKDTIDLPKLYILITTLTLLIGLSILYWKDNNQLLLKKDKTIYYSLLFLAFVFLSSYFSDYTYRVILGKYSRWEGMISYLTYILTFLFFFNFVIKKTDIKKILKVTFYAGILVSIYGLLQIFKLDPIEHSEMMHEFNKRAFVTMGNPNFAGTYAVILLSISIILYLFKSDNKIHKFYLFTTSIFYALLIATATRSAMLGFAITFIFTVIFFKDYLLQNKKAILIIILIFIIITIGIDFYQGGFITNRVLALVLELQKLGGDETERGTIGLARYTIYKHGFPLLLKNPIFGSGPDTFDKVFPQMEYFKVLKKVIVVDKAHNEYLQIGVTLGLPALFFYLMLLGIIYKKGIKALKRLKNNITELNIYHVALFMAVVSYTIQALFNISVVSVAPVFWAILGLNVAISKMED